MLVSCYLNSYSKWILRKNQLYTVFGVTVVYELL